MGTERQKIPKRHRCLFSSLVLCQTVLVACSDIPTAKDLESVSYAPLQRADWQVSTPEARGIDPLRIATLYYHAARLDSIRSLVVIKDGFLIAEGYFNGGSPGQEAQVQSVSKSYTSAAVGLALKEGYLDSVDQTMIALVHDSNMVVVVTADPLEGDHGGNAWGREKANLNLAADFVASLPGKRGG